MTLCPCGSGKELEACCGPILDGASSAPTAEALMRARYAAHALGRYDFLTESTHPEFREEADADDIREWSSLMTWESLEILETSAGGPEDETGEVSFCAHYSVQGMPPFDSLRRFSARKTDAGSMWKAMFTPVSPCAAKAPRSAATIPAPAAAERNTKNAAEKINKNDMRVLRQKLRHAFWCGIKGEGEGQCRLSK